jgi:hypothetical protein
MIDELDGSALWRLEHLIRINPWQAQNVNDCVLMTQGMATPENSGERERLSSRLAPPIEAR